MKSIFLAQWMKEKRSPFMVLIFCGLSIIATLLFGVTTDSKVIVDVFSDEGVDEAEEAFWLDRLNESEAYEFKVKDERQARLDVREGRSSLAIRLMEGDYRIIATVQDSNVQLVEQHVRTIFEEELQLRFAEALSDDQAQFREDVDRYLAQPPLILQMEASDGGEIISYDMGLQLLFAFTLFLVIFTIGFKVNAITKEKASGIWNRIILSPVSKTNMYLGHLSYSFLIGFVQVLIVFLIFLYGFRFDFGENFGMLLIVSALYTLTMVAFVMLLTGILRTPEQFIMVFPAVIPIIPMISGAYMPPGTITNPFILAVAEIFPLTHAMKALMEIAVYDASLSDVLMPVAKLLLIGVICMGVGINLVERSKA